MVSTRATRSRGTPSASTTRPPIENVGGLFDIGRFVLGQPQFTPDEKLDFTVQIANSDGDTATRDIFSVGIDGTGTFDDDHVDGVLIA